MRDIIIGSLLTVVGSATIYIISFCLKERIENRNLKNALCEEIDINLGRVTNMGEDLKKIKSPVKKEGNSVVVYSNDDLKNYNRRIANFDSKPLDTDSYKNILAKGKLQILVKDKKIREELRVVYELINDYNRIINDYNRKLLLKKADYFTIFIDLSEKLEHLKNDLKSLKFNKRLIFD